MSWGAGDHERRTHALIQFGTISEVDPARGRARVRLSGEATTGWLPFTAIRAGALNAWAPVTPGEQVVLIAPGGDTGQGVILGSLASGANAAPSSDGGEFRFEIGASSISMTASGITLAVGGVSLIVSAGGVAITGGAVTHNGVNIGDTHQHTGVTAGPSTTGPPA